MSRQKAGRIDYRAVQVAKKKSTLRDAFFLSRAYIAANELIINVAYSHHNASFR